MGEYLFIPKHFFLYLLAHCFFLYFFTIFLLFYLLKEWGYYKNVKKSVTFLLYFDNFEGYFITF